MPSDKRAANALMLLLIRRCRHELLVFAHDAFSLPRLRVAAPPLMLAFGFRAAGVAADITPPLTLFVAGYRRFADYGCRR